MNIQIRSLLISSALLIGATASFAARADSEVESLVKATLSGQNVPYTQRSDAERAASAVSSEAAPDAATITRQVLRGESTAVAAARPGVAVEATTAQVDAVTGRSDSWRLAQRLLLGHAG